MGKMKKLMAAAIAAVALGMQGSAWSADTHTLTVNASVTGKCKFASATSTMPTITVDPSATGNVTGTQNVSFTCTKGSTSAMTLASTSTGSATGGNLANGAENFAYTFSKSGDAQLGTGHGAGQEKTLAVTVTINQANAANVTAGTYTDTVSITVTP